MSAVLLGILPWVGLGAFMAFALRLPRPLPEAPSALGDGAPRVAVIVPARNEATNIEACVASLASQDYPDFQIVVVDDGSTDETGARARGVARGNARTVRVVPGRPLPPGWFGKPWACATGAEAVLADPGTGAPELLLFTDADTRHHPELLARAVAAMEEDRAHCLSLVGRQELGSFWERLVQPQVFALIGLRYRRLDRIVTPDRWKDAIANGQYVLIERDRYQAMGGHGAVRGEVVEDLRLAQEVTRRGGRLSVRGAEEVFSTRMYTSLRELVNGWTKNLAVGARQSAVGWGPFALAGIVGFLLLAWVLPATSLAAAVATRTLAGTGGPASLPLLTSVPFVASAAFLVWALAATLLSTLLWAVGYARFGVSPLHALLHPVGALVVAFIVVRSGWRGTRRIEWKGRRYEGGEAAEGREPGR